MSSEVTRKLNLGSVLLSRLSYLIQALDSMAVLGILDVALAR